MNLRKYDGKCIQIIDINNYVYEGYCTYNDNEYTMHEYGVNEESLDIMNILFYKSNIKKIVILNNDGLYGKFTEPYGEIEKMIVDDIDLLEEAFDSEENEHIYRVLLCLEKNNLTKEKIELIKKLIKCNNDEKVIRKANEILDNRKEGQYGF